MPVVIFLGRKHTRLVFCVNFIWQCHQYSEYSVLVFVVGIHKSLPRQKKTPGHPKITFPVTKTPWASRNKLPRLKEQHWASRNEFPRLQERHWASKGHPRLKERHWASKGHPRLTKAPGHAKIISFVPKRPWCYECCGCDF